MSLEPQLCPASCNDCVVAPTRAVTVVFRPVPKQVRINATPTWIPDFLDGMLFSGA